MAQVDLASGSRPFEADVDAPPIRFKPSELPLSQSQRSVIDGILHTFKKKGEFDALRKQVWDQYSESVSPCLLFKCIVCDILLTPLFPGGESLLYHLSGGSGRNRNRSRSFSPLP